MHLCKGHKNREQMSNHKRIFPKFPVLIAFAIQVGNSTWHFFKANSRFITVALLTILALGILGAVVYFVYSQSAKNDQPTVTLNDPPIVEEDTSAVTPTATPDSSAAIQPDSTRTLPQATVSPASADSSFSVVLEIAKRDRAMKRYADLREWGHKVVMTTTDSVSFKIFLPIKAPLADTAKYRDSLAGFFARKVWIENQ